MARLLFRVVVKEGLLEEVTFAQRSDQSEEVSRGGCGGVRGAFQVRGPASAKAPRQGYGWSIQGTTMKLVW